MRRNQGSGARADCHAIALAFASGNGSASATAPRPTSDVGLCTKEKGAADLDRLTLSYMYKLGQQTPLTDPGAETKVCYK